MAQLGFLTGRVAAGLSAALLLGACAVAPEPASLSFDPLEAENREVHVVNKQLDRQAFGPVARAWGGTVPQRARRGVTNLRDHWRLPGHTIQYALQGDGLRVAQSATRFAVNSVFGFAGLLDPAAEMALPYRETNFDETFYIWGIPEGGYLELPFLGPGTQRDWTGWVLDQVLDPVYYVLPMPVTNGLLAVAGLNVVDERYEFNAPIEALLHESADSYTAQRISYLQNMRARLQGGADLDQLEDIYADF